MSEALDVRRYSVTDETCWDGLARMHAIIGNTASGFSVLCAEKPHHLKHVHGPHPTLEDAERAARVYWMDRLGWRFQETKLAQERRLTLGSA